MRRHNERKRDTDYRTTRGTKHRRLRDNQRRDEAEAVVRTTKQRREDAA